MSLKMGYSPGFSIFLILTITVLGCGATRHVTTAKCRSRETSQCTNYDLVQSLKFQAFIGDQEFDEKCRAFKEVFDCVYELVQSCPSRHRFAFDVQKTVIDQVCFVRRIDYKESQRCFMQKNLPERANQCLTSIKLKDCRSTDPLAECLKNTVTSTDGCTSKDGDLMRSLADAWTLPFRNTLKCDNTSAPLLATISPTTTATTTTTVTTTTTTGTTPTTTMTTRRKKSTTVTSRKDSHQMTIQDTTYDFQSSQRSFTSNSTAAKMSALGNTSSVSWQQATPTTLYSHGIADISNSTTREGDKVIGRQAIAAHSNNTASIVSYRSDTSVRFACGIAVVFIQLTY